MFKPFKNGSSIVIQEAKLATTVYIPPVGYGYDRDTRELIKTDILQRSQDPDEQFWERPTRPDDWEKKRRLEKRKIKEDPDYYDEDLENHRDREWHRRNYGVWVMINGEPVFITGGGYFYLTHWKLDVGYPDYRKPDIEWWYYWAYVCEDPLSYGLIELTRRRQGKTARAACAMYEMISRRKEAYGGIQSKTKDDAKKSVFAKGVIQPFKKMIDFFRPVYDTAKGITPTTELRFFKTTKKGGDQDYEYDESNELESWIDFRASTDQAYDGDKLHCYIGDEVGKTIEIDVYDRHDIVKPCFEDPDTHEIIGKAIYTTTVEEMEAGGAPFTLLWKDSDKSPEKLTPNGKTISGLYRYFMPTYKTGDYDKFGNPDETKMRNYYLNERKGLEGNPKKLAAHIRKFPFTWEEAMRSDGAKCIYNELKLTQREDILNIKDDLTERGNFIWKDGERDTEVVWQKNSRGRWEITRLPEPENQNLVKRIGNTLIPNNITQIVSGFDPYDHNITVDGQGSMGAGAVYHKYNERIDPVMSENFICVYHARPPKAAILYEDAIKTAVFYGCKALIEDNKVGMIQYFEDRGYKAFLDTYNGKVGVNGNAKTHIALAEATEAFIEDNAHRTMYAKMVREWLGFDLQNTTKFDIAMAAGYALMAAGSMIRKIKKLETKVNVSSYYKKRKIINKR